MDLPLTHPRAKGGTMVLWHHTLSPYLKVLPSPSPSFVSVLLSLPGVLPSIHTAVYLPTAGKDGDWVATLLELEQHVIENFSKHGNIAIFVRGDFNASSKNKTRSLLFSSFIRRLDLTRLSLPHPTYHHFVGDGASDSDLDQLLYGGNNIAMAKESLVHIICELENPLMFSHHDMIISTCILPPKPSDKLNDAENISAPRVPNQRFATKWSEEGVAEYELVTSPLLSQIRDTWGKGEDSTSISMLLSTTYAALNLVTQATNRTIPLDKKFTPKPKKDPDVAAAAKTSLQDLHHLNLLESSVHTPGNSLETARSKLAASRNKYRREVRASLARERDMQDAKLSEILSKNPNAVFRAFKAASKSSAPAVNKMKVGSKVYSGDKVPDGIFDSLAQLKAPAMDPYRDSEQYMEAVSTYDHIMKLASCGRKMPLISLADGERLLRGLRPSVMDYFSITSLHFLYLGQQGIFHFVFLLNTIISHINSSSISELNTIWAIVLHKGHNKDPELDRSWRTISCCPIIAKALDTYLVELYGDGWSDIQAPTQFQGSNSSHELAALSITEAINHSLYVNKQPVYLLFSSYSMPRAPLTL